MAGLDPSRSSPGRILAFACWLYTLFLLALIAFIRSQGDRAVFATVLIFSPKWIWLLPLALLVPLSIRFNRRSWLILSASVLLGVFPLLGFNLGMQRLRKAPQGVMSLRLITFNIHHLDMMDPSAVRVVRDASPDIVALEEVPAHINPNLFPPDWHVMQVGENLLASRLPILSSEEIIWGAAVSYRMDLAGRPVEVIVVHLASPHFPLRNTLVGTPEGDRDLHANIALRREEAAFLDARASDAKEPLIIAGDFNLAPESQIFRAHLGHLTDCFQAVGFGFGWTYRSRWTALRIDHVLSNTWFVAQSCQTGPDLGSPHRPLISNLILR